MRQVVVVALGMLMGGHAVAQDVDAFYSGDDLRRDCSSSSPTEIDRCDSYIIDAADMWVLLGRFMDPSPRYRSCIPKSTGQAELRDAIRKWVVENPQVYEKQASTLVATALHGAFPC